MPRFDVEVGDGEYVPPPSMLTRSVREPEDPRRKLRRAAGSIAGMLGTAAVVALAVTFTAQATVGSAVQQGSDAVGVQFRLPDDVGLQELTERSYIYASDGQELQVLDREENRRIVDLEEIPLVVQQAVITAEDRRFYEHEGYDPEGIGRALVTNLGSGSLFSQGASTITQQLARTAPGVGSQDEGIEAFMRKFREIAYAVALEDRFSKEELLGQYLNQVYFGFNSYGVAAAAEEYFGVTDVRALTVEQGALLAAVIRQPNNANPRTDPDRATARRNLVLDAMVAEGYIDQPTADAAKATPLTVVENTPRVRPYDFIADSVIREFLYNPEFEQFGTTVEDREQQLWFGGLRIHSSLDPRLQEIAHAVIARTFPSDPARPTGAIVSVDPRTGRILVAHSGLDYSTEQLAIPTQARRQPGSAAKPFVYAEALRQGFPPNIALSGASPAFYENIPGWTRRDGGVENYGGASYGSLDMPNALRQSVNTATVQLALTVGIEPVVNLMGEMGINTQAATNGITNPSLALGGFDHGVTPLEMAAAFATFANGGAYIKPHFIDRIEDRDGNVIYAAQHEPRQVFTPEINAQMVRMMQGTVTGGTGTRARISGWQVAGKTGTTQDGKDAWFVGFTPTMSTAMWMGVANPPRPLGTTGGGIPATVWQQYMAQALQGQQPVPFPEVAVPDGRLAAGQPVAVPNVTGQAQGDALRALGSVRLFGQVRGVPNRARAGTVIGQSPRAGTPATTGDTVTLQVSTGQAPAPPPPPPQPGQPPQPPDPGIPQPQGNGNGNGNGGGPGPPGND